MDFGFILSIIAIILYAMFYDTNFIKKRFENSKIKFKISFFIILNFLVFIIMLWMIYIDKILFVILLSIVLRTIYDSFLSIKINNYKFIKVMFGVQITLIVLFIIIKYCFLI